MIGVQKAPEITSGQNREKPKNWGMCPKISCHIHQTTAEIMAPITARATTGTTSTNSTPIVDGSSTTVSDNLLPSPSAIMIPLLSFSIFPGSEFYNTLTYLYQ